MNRFSAILSRLSPLASAVLCLLMVACGEEPGRVSRGSGGAGNENADLPESARELSLATGMGLLRRGDYEGAEPHLVEALRASPRNPRILEALGTLYARSDRTGRAEGVFREALSIRPDLVGARLGLASILVDAGLYDEALDLVEEVQRQHPSNVVAASKRALLLVRKGRAEEGETAARDVLSVHPGHIEARYVLGLALLHRGNLEDAAAELRRVLDREPDHLGALGNLTKIEMRLGNRDEAETLSARHQATIRQMHIEERVRGRRLAAVEAFNREDYAAALVELEAISIEDPGDPQVHLYLGSTHLALGDYGAARAALEKSLALEARNERALMELGRLDAIENRLDEAIDHLRRAIAVNPEFGEPHYFLAGIYMAQGRPDLSQEEMSKFQDLRSRSSGAAMEVVTEPPGGDG